MKEFGTLLGRRGYLLGRRSYLLGRRRMEFTISEIAAVAVA